MQARGSGRAAATQPHTFDLAATLRVLYCAPQAVKRQAEADQKEAMLEAMTEAITRQENEVGPLCLAKR